MKNFKLLLLIGVVFLTASCSKDEDESITLEKKIENIAKPYIDNGSRQGIAIGTYDNGVTNFYSYGTKHHVDGGAIDQNTLFEIGDITKTFTATLLAKMVIDGEVTMTDEVQGFFPNTVNFPSYVTTEVQLQHLANHTSALPTMPNNLDVDAEEDMFIAYTEDKLYTYLNSYSLVRAPGNAMEYSNLGMGILGYVLKNHKNTTYKELLSSEILTPLGMTSTVLEFEDATSTNIAQGYSGDNLADELLYSEVFEGAGAIKSNVADMLKFIEANLSANTAALYDALRQTQDKTIDTPQGGDGMGMGWFILNLNDGQLARFHDGGTPGYSSYIALNPETNRGVVVLINTNTANSFAQLDIGVAIMKALHAQQ